MHTFAAAGAAFLICVLWFDLMFDVQVRGHDGDQVPAAALASISGYYRRVTREAWPMNRLIAVVMLLTLLVIILEIVFGRYHWWIGWISLVAAASAIGLARFRTIPNASRLGKASDSPEEQSRLARRIYTDHLFCIAAMILVLVLQLGAHHSHRKHHPKPAPEVPQSAVL
ncbi:hypothetical protein [Candidatus Binatus sp.]|uniref:hypothetical protein n=1 Tax=Candidatus Binatus sp. TaxID=2811406 RepID=UPI003C9517AA